MANQALFQTCRGSRLPQADAINQAGAPAYRLGAKHTLAQFAATGCLNGTYYSDAADQLNTVLILANQVEPEFVARTARYCRREGFMKDMPALLCAVLASRDVSLLGAIFSDVIDNGKMLRNFVQILRSGATGRKSLGTAPKRLVRRWLETASAETLFRASVGQNPSLADVIKMVHPKPKDAHREVLYGYLLGKSHDPDKLPQIIRDFEAYKRTRAGDPPAVPFQMLTALDLGTPEWTAIARNAGWQMTRMNLNTFARHGVLNMTGMQEIIAGRLRSPEAIRRARCFPYQLMAAFMNVGTNVPRAIKEALQDAMEIAVENVPVIDGNVVVAPDVSGSMQMSVSGYRKGSSSKVRCVDVAALVAAAILRKNPGAIVLPFANDVVEVDLNPRDSILTNAKKLASLPSGGTNCSSVLRYLNRRKTKVDLLVYVSDNESWMDGKNYGWCGGGRTATMEQWRKLKHRNGKAKMVCLDVVPNATSQTVDAEDILNIGGFSDRVFDVMAKFNQPDTATQHWVEVIEKVELTSTAPNPQTV